MTSFDETLAEAGGSCAQLYIRGGEIRPELQCPDRVDFAVRLSSQHLRKARLSCAEHLADVLWRMQSDHGGYAGQYVLTARHQPWANEAARYENDEPVEDVIGAFHAGAKGVTARPLIFDVAGAALPEPTSRTLPAHVPSESQEVDGHHDGQEVSHPGNDPESVKLPMACRHGDHAADAEATLAAARVLLNSPEHFLSAAVYYLEHGFSASVTGIVADMWARVTVQTYDDRLTVSCECDLVEDGLAAVIMWLAAHRTDHLADDEAPEEAEEASGG